MFKFLKRNPLRKYRKAHAELMKKALDAQRNGKMALFAKLSTEAELIYNKILEIEKEENN